MDYTVISADSHINEPPNAFDRVPANLKDKAPRMMRAADGGDGWSWDGKQPARGYGLNAVAGKSPEHFGDSGIKFEDIMPGNYDGAAHIKDMALDGVDASVLYPMAALGAYSCPDREIGVAVMRAYNDWLIEDFCGVDSKRLISIAEMPVDDGMDVTLEELRRVAKKGVNGLFLPGCPQRPYQDQYYDPLWAEAQERGLSVNFHRNHGGTPPESDRQDNQVAGIVIRFHAAIRPFANMIFSGVFERFPKLKVVSAETNFGWLPYFIQMMEQEYDHQRFQANLPITKRPIEYIRNNIYTTYLDDMVGFNNFDQIPVTSPMFSSDYPHSVTIWPNSRKYIAEQTANLSPEVKHAVLAGNAMKVYNLT